MIVTATFAQGDNTFDPFYHAQTNQLTKFGFALQRGELVIVGSGGVQFARPAPIPIIATKWGFEGPQSGAPTSSSSPDCGGQSSSSSGQALPGAIWTAQESQPWHRDDGLFQFMLPCGGATIKFEFE